MANRYLFLRANFYKVYIFELTSDYSAIIKLRFN